MSNHPPHSHEMPGMKSTMVTMGEALMETMAPMLSGSLASDEAKAWDDYVTAALKALLAKSGDFKDVKILCGQSVRFADELLAARQERFNAESFKKKLAEILGPQMGRCGEPLENSPMRCALMQGHEGKHSPVAPTTAAAP